MTAVLAPPALEGVSIVLPCFDEAQNVAAAVGMAAAAGRRARARARGHRRRRRQHRRTLAIATALAACDRRVRVVVHPTNRGYGAALRSGIGPRASRGCC